VSTLGYIECRGSVLAEGELPECGCVYDISCRAGQDGILQRSYRKRRVKVHHYVQILILWFPKHKRRYS